MLWWETLYYAEVYSGLARLTFLRYRVRSLIGSPLFYLLANFVFCSKLFLTFSSVFVPLREFRPKVERGRPRPLDAYVKNISAKGEAHQERARMLHKTTKNESPQRKRQNGKKKPRKKCALTENPGEESLGFFFLRGRIMRECILGYRSCMSTSSFCRACY